MHASRHLILFPTQIRENDILTINTSDGSFANTHYEITGKSGNIIRKGTITSKLLELKLRIVGLKSGEYNFIMGDLRQNFVVM